MYIAKSFKIVLNLIELAPSRSCSTSRNFSYLKGVQNLAKPACIILACSLIQLCGIFIKQLSGSSGCGDNFKLKSGSLDKKLKSWHAVFLFCCFFIQPCSKNFWIKFLLDKKVLNSYLV